jgi:hypothetical protein
LTQASRSTSPPTTVRIPAKPKTAVADLGQEEAGLAEQDAAAGVLGIISAELRGDRVELARRLRLGHAGLEAADDEEVVARAALEPFRAGLDDARPSSSGPTSRA